MRFDKEDCIIDFGVDKRTLSQIIQKSEAFQTTGCPNCNRPYYNEKPSGPIYNYPKDLTEKEFSLIKHQLESSGAIEF
jgi:biotin synthase